MASDYDIISSLVQPITTTPKIASIVKDIDEAYGQATEVQARSSMYLAQALTDALVCYGANVPVIMTKGLELILESRRQVAEPDLSLLERTVMCRWGVNKIAFMTLLSASGDLNVLFPSSYRDPDITRALLLALDSTLERRSGVVRDMLIFDVDIEGQDLSDGGQQEDRRALAVMFRVHSSHLRTCSPAQARFIGDQYIWIMHYALIDPDTDTDPLAHDIDAVQRLLDESVRLTGDGLVSTDPTLERHTLVNRVLGEGMALWSMLANRFDPEPYYEINGGHLHVGMQFQLGVGSASRN